MKFNDDNFWLYIIHDDVTRKTGIKSKKRFLQCLREDNFLWAYLYYAAVRVLGGLFFGRA